MNQAAMIAAIYVVLTIVGTSVSFGPVQLRFAEALTILPLFYTGSDPRPVYRMPDRQHAGRCDLTGYCVRQYRHADRCLWFLVCA